MSDNESMLPRLSYRFNEIEKLDQIYVGSSGVTMGELFRTGVQVTNGFVLSSDCYFRFLKQNNLITKINHLLGTVHYDDSHSLLQVAAHIKKLIRESELDDSLTKALVVAYASLGNQETPVFLIPSPASDIAVTSVVLGSHTGHLAVGEATFISTIKEIWSSLFDARYIYYRHEKKIDHFQIGMAVIVKNFLPCESSGKMYSTNPLNHDKSSLVIEARYGLEFSDEKQQPMDYYLVSKSSGEIAKSFVVEQLFERVRVGNELHTVRVPENKASKPKLSPTLISELHKIANLLEKHYYFPVECTWISHNNKIHILTCKPLTLHPVTDSNHKQFPDASRTGVPMTQGIASGHIRVITDEKDLKKILPGEIVVFKRIPSEFPPEMKKAYGIISEHATYDPQSIHQFKTLGKPVVGGISDATIKLKNASVWTVNGATGELTPGGLLRTAFHKKSMPPQKRTATKAFLMLESDRDISQLSLYQSDGVGILDGNELIRSLNIHPKKILSDKQSSEYHEKLKQAIHSVTADFNPRPVLYKLSNLSSSEYRQLSGGKTHEPIEENPLLGLRGGSRYLHDPKVIQTEINTLHKLRESGMTNLHLIVPFMRSPQELSHMLEYLKKAGLTASRTFQVWLSIDTPAQAILLDAYLKQPIDGIILNPDSLGALFTGADPSNSEVAALVHEDAEALLHAYQYCIRRANKFDKASLITLRSSENADQLISKLIEWGISGIVVKPESIENLRKTIYKYERTLIT